MCKVDLLAIGEPLVVMVPASDGLSWPVSAGGAELNVARVFAALGFETGYLGVVGDDPFGRLLVEEMRLRGVSWLGAVTSERRTGFYLKEKSSHGRRRVHYYRAGSAGSTLRLANTTASSRVVHVTGVTAALDASLYGDLQSFFRRARHDGSFVSFDINYRPELWGRRDAQEELSALARLADLVFVGEDEAEELWAESDATALANRLRPARVVRKSHGVAVTIAERGTAPRVIPIDPAPTVDAVGAGDAFAAGYLLAALHGADASAAVGAGHALATRTMLTSNDVLSNRDIREAMQPIVGGLTWTT